MRRLLEGINSHHNHRALSTNGSLRENRQREQEQERGLLHLKPIFYFLNISLARERNEAARRYAEQLA